MKILWVFKTRRHNHLMSSAKRLHYDFIMKLEAFAEIIRIEPEKILKRVREHNPDIILVYSYHSIKKSTELEVFKDIDIPKLCIEVDYYSVKDMDWYKRNGFCLVHRGHIPNDPNPWLPFSCDEQLLRYQRNKLSIREHRIGFTGSYKIGSRILWKTRGNAIQQLKRADLIHINGTNGNVGHKFYPANLASSFCALACSGYVVNSPFGKVFEVMGSGTLLMTTPLNASNILFGCDNFFYTYKKDCSDVVAVARKILSDPIKRQQEMVDEAANIIGQAHTDSHRIAELLEIIYAVMDNREVPRRWIP